MDPIRCPENSFAYDSTLCACNPGYYRDRSGGCRLFEPGDGDWTVGTRAGPAGRPFLDTVLPLESLERMVRSEDALLRAVLVVTLVWLAFCVAVRLGRIDGGRTVWFRIRWSIAQLDLFATNHDREGIGGAASSSSSCHARSGLSFDSVECGLAPARGGGSASAHTARDDNKVVRKRKSELGGTLSVVSWILFIGLLSALLYQLITRRSIEVHRVRPSNAMDLKSFISFEFNITTVSSMSCSHMRGLDKLVIGTPGFIDCKVFPLSNYANYSCYNTTWGPTVSLKCNNCQIPTGDHYISWQFVDLPDDPAAAVGFQFNLSAKAHNDNRHVSYVSGTLNSGSYLHNRAVTFRGPDLNIMKIHLFPQKFDYLKDNLWLIQPLVHDFLPGSFFYEIDKLRASLRSSKDGLVNTTLCISYLSDYIVEIDKENILGIVALLSDVGGLCTITLAISLYFLHQCESRIKKLQMDDTEMRDIRRRRRAQQHWDKLRIYVRYTWGHSNLNMRSRTKPVRNSIIECFSRVYPDRKHKSRLAGSLRNFV
ncbi:uncharacterized protein LOC135585139 isoform X2 [Musa acuminata AAA Group]|uniref:uncharacterized protein LOC135585139 isoform X2 n=1 Tax=Musa acuminata AAA Group TaxID=214697 RepID=UPI0031E3F65F